MDNLTAQNENLTLDWALHYAAHGYRVIPIKPREKRPPMSSWQDVATTETGTITAWWRGNYTDHGIGIVTGTLDDGTRYFVLDIDEHDPAASGKATIDRLEQEHGTLPDTITARTGSGGIHRLYRLADHHRDIGNGAGRLLGAGIDVRAINAQIVVAPTVHPNGRLYEWVTDHAIGEIDMATAPDWLVSLLTPVDVPREISSAKERLGDTKEIPSDTTTDTRAGTRFNRETTWDDLLAADGWTPHGATGAGHTWTRPNKNPRDGASATVNYNDNDRLTVFTTSITNLPAGTYDRFGYWTQTRHSGDFSDAARQLNAHSDQQIDSWVRSIQNDAPPLIATPTEQTDTDPLGTWYVDWTSLWDDDTPQGEWLLEPILARGRAHALYASAKSGKSLLLLELAAALATGRAVLNQPARDPIPVLYVDYEMTAADIRDRLEAFGYDRTIDLTNLHYVLLPSIAGLDTPEGAKTVIAAVKQKNIQLVVIDTTARAVEGEENTADTYRAFYRWTGVNLKALGCTWIRLDHAGKDKERGQRGSSSKNDDVDLVWRFTKRNTTSILLEATHKRMNWVTDKIELELREHDGVLMHTIVGGDQVSEAATQLAAQLDRLGAPADIANRVARQLLKDNGIKAASDILRSALRLRKTRITGGAVEAWLDTIEETTTTKTSVLPQRLPYNDDLF